MPGPAITIRGCSTNSTASFCSGFNIKISALSNFINFRQLITYKMQIKLFIKQRCKCKMLTFILINQKNLKAKFQAFKILLIKLKKILKKFENKKSEYIQKKEQKKKIELNTKKEWYEKFRFTKTSNQFLVVIGKDAGTNEVLIKKHMEENDIVMHTEAPGSPFGLIKSGKEKVSKQDIEEAAQFLTCFSSQWKKGFGTADAFWVLPEQVTKKAQSGEYMSKGSFMIYGKKNIIKNINLQICLGIIKKEIKIENEIIFLEELFSGSEKACQRNCPNRYVKIEPGDINYKALTKEIKKRLKTSQIEDLPKYIPNNCKILKK